MAQPFIGEIRMFGGNFAPQGWAMCDGQLLSIAENNCRVGSLVLAACVVLAAGVFVPDGVPSAAFCCCS